MPRVSLPITTERLVLRSFRPGDVDDVLAYRSVPDVVRYIPGEPKTREQVVDMVAHSATAGLIDDKHTHVTLAVELDGRVVGDVLIHLDGLDGSDGRQVELGWVFAPDVQGQGYATEAARALMPRPRSPSSAPTGSGPSSSRRTPRRRGSASGSACAGRRSSRRASWFKERWTDLAVYAIRADEWSGDHQVPAVPAVPAELTETES